MGMPGPRCAGPWSRLCANESGLCADRSRVHVNESGVPTDGLDWSDTRCLLTQTTYYLGK